MAMNTIRDNVQKILRELPPGVQLVAVGKGRSAAEIREAVAAGAGIIGENYLQEALAVQPEIGHKAKWHFIGHLQKNKVKQAVGICDVIETVDSMELAQEIDKRCRLINKVMPVLIEINSGREPNKSGVMPEQALELAQQIACLHNIKINGLMTMGPVVENPADIRPYFQLTQRLFEQIKAGCIPGVDMGCLSMGMSGSYRIAIEEGANLVRIGRGIFDR
ncbi:MAG: YggS family pyridoxal phosphate-dependent enzyme [Dehalococcoidales bacterium]|nr:YggS family pyridoxal phosphate-dependent enzyme [Dehalococcoidales bacterium]